PPPLDDPELAARGLHHFRAHCVQCHGAPGVPPEPFALGLTPLPGSLSDVAREWTPSQLYWVIRNGIKMTGLPAWQFRLDEEELWSVVAFRKTRPDLSPRAYGDSPAAGPVASQDATRAPAPDAARGSRALRQFGCVGCHVIPGV